LHRIPVSTLASIEDAGHLHLELSVTLAAKDDQSMDRVGLALILAADGSASVSFEEFNLIAGGMAAALRDPDVVAGLTSGGAMLAVLLFSGAGDQDLVIGWTRIATPPDLAAFADRVDAMPRALRPGLTAIGDALVAAERIFTTLPAPAARRIIDIAADGSANDGLDPAPVRDRLVAEGIVINGLCVLHEEPDLVAVFTREVIGGPGAFALPCVDYAGFAAAQRMKLLREMVA
jgi:hypothetical protein